MSQILSVRDLHAGYGKIPILSGVTFDVGEREYLGILGHNGMGKTTLMRTLMGALPATKGAISFRGANITHSKVHERSRSGLGLVPQGREIFATLTVMENLRMGMASAHKEDSGVIDDVLNDFPRLHRLLDRPGGALSGGEQQLLALARCLCTRPSLVLLDEPTEGIQPSIIEEIIETLLRLKERRGLSMIIVEQNLDFINGLSDRIIGIQKGHVTEKLDHIEMGAGGVLKLV